LQQVDPFTLTIGFANSYIGEDTERTNKIITTYGGLTLVASERILNVDGFDTEILELRLIQKK